jgi:S-adenosylmethionine:tRNA ribosyltransferase-isomerase
MNPATAPIQRPRDAKLLRIDAAGRLHHGPRSNLIDHLHPGDLLVANDAATLPASLHGRHVRSNLPIEIRLAARHTSQVRDLHQAQRFSAIAFGAGDHRSRTEDRPAPPELRRGDVLTLGPLRAQVQRLLGHPRFVELLFEGTFKGTSDAFWAGLAQHGKPIQYAHLPAPLALWDGWTAIAVWPVAFEPPSAGFVLDWRLLARLRERGVGFATLTHAAGISSTGDEALDARLPLDEPYFIPKCTVSAIAKTQAAGARVVALGTTVTRALEHAAANALGLRAGDGLATQRLGAHSSLRVVDAIVSGTHEPGTSHRELLRAFTSDAVLAQADAELSARGYLTHEFGDSVWLDKLATRLTTSQVSASPRGAAAQFAQS